MGEDAHIMAPSPYPGRLQFTGEDANASASSGDPYVNGNFSGDFTIDGTWTRARLTAAGVVTSITDTSGISYAPNVHYKIDLGNNWFVEPTVGVTYTQVFAASFGIQTGDSTQVSGGARFGGDYNLERR